MHQWPGQNHLQITHFNTKGTCPVTTKQHLAFCQRIIGYCQQQQWYGPDGKRRQNPVAPGFIDQQGIWHEPDEHIFDYRGSFDEQGKLQMRAITHDPHIGFEFPPATEKQLQETEEGLGFPLPPLLRALYTHVANGGFGPAYGVTGTSSGYYFGDDGHYRTVGMKASPVASSGSVTPAKKPLDLVEYERERGDPLSIDLPPHIWPDHFFQICYLGCGMDAYLHAVSGRVYRVESSYSQTEGVTISLTRLEETLEIWLESWMNGKAHL
jgi:hypothetical protein